MLLESCLCGPSPHGYLTLVKGDKNILYYVLEESHINCLYCFDNAKMAVFDVISEEIEKYGENEV